MVKQVRVSPEVLRRVINHNFSFSDLSKRFENVDSSTGNIFCPFHENYTTPAAKMYWDDIQDMWVIWCFSEQRRFTAYDYVDLIMCKEREQYRSPLEFLKANMNSTDLYNQVNLYKSEVDDLTQIAMQAKIDYINNIYAEHENLVDYIEELYTA